jgi:hypothetical protein
VLQYKMRRWRQRAEVLSGLTDASKALNSRSFACLYSSISFNASVRASLSFCTRSVNASQWISSAANKSTPNIDGPAERSWRLPSQPRGGSVCLVIVVQPFIGSVH